LGIRDWNNAILLLAGGALMVGCEGCRDGEKAGSLLPAVVVSGDTEGWIVPCGCASKQFGGLPRRATYVKDMLRKGRVLLVDAGGAAAGTSAYDRAKFEAIARGEVVMGVAAHNIGASEAAMVPDALRDVARRIGLPLVSANVRDRQGKLLGEAVRVVEIGGRRVAVVGVLDPRYATDEIEVGPPQAAVLDALATIENDEPCDAVVVLAYLPEESLRALAEMLPEVDLVVGGPTGQPIQPTRVGPVLLASATNKGKFLAAFAPDANVGESRFTGRIVELDESFVDDGAQLANLKRFYEELGRRDFRPEETSFAVALPKTMPPGFAVAGPKRCAECHEEEYAVWRESKHRHAWDTLKEKGAHVNPDCQRCHVTGYGMPGGFESLAQGDTRVDVACESCHGPSLAHCEDETVHTAYYGQQKNHCESCHDRENSPEFSFETYWPKMRHGPGKVEPQMDADEHR